MVEYQFIRKPRRGRPRKNDAAQTPKQAGTLCRTCRFLREGKTRACCRRWKTLLEIEDYKSRKKLCGCWMHEPVKTAGVTR